MVSQASFERVNGESGEEGDKDGCVEVEVGGGWRGRHGRRLGDLF